MIGSVTGSLQKAITSHANRELPSTQDPSHQGPAGEGESTAPRSHVVDFRSLLAKPKSKAGERSHSTESDSAGSFVHLLTPDAGAPRKGCSLCEVFTRCATQSVYLGKDLLPERIKGSEYDTEDDLKAFTWDWCLVFKIGDKEKTIEVPARRKKGDTREVDQYSYFRRRTTMVVDQLHDAGLNVKLFKSVQEDELFCLIGASEARLRLEAQRTRYELELDAEECLETAANKKPPMLLALKTRAEEQGVEEARLCQRDNWDHVYGRYDEDAPRMIYKRNRNNKMHPNSLFYNSDRLKLTISIMEAEQRVGGAGIDTAFEGAHNPVADSFPIHQKRKLDNLAETWIPKLSCESILKFWKFEQPLDHIRRYFGENIALYFAFLGFYNKFMAIPAFFGLCFFFAAVGAADDKVDVRGIAALGIIVSVWSALFIEFWKREQNKLAILWGQTNFKKLEQPRPGYSGEWVASMVNGQKEEYFPRSKRMIRMFFSSTVIFTLIASVVAVVAGIFFLRAAFHEESLQPYSFVISIINAIQIQIFNFIYSFVAERLNEWENHRTDSEFESNLIGKSFIFRFINSYNSFYYIAFFKWANEGCGPDQLDDPKYCLPELQQQLAIIMATIIFMNNATELLLPSLKQKFLRKREKKAMTSEQLAHQTDIEREADLDVYRTFEDYDELIVQFGYVTLFIVAFPLTPFLAFMNNWFEIWLDSRKLCKICQRPEPRGADSIGTWLTILNIMCYIVIATNLAMVVFVTSDFDALIERFSNFNDVTRGAALVFVFLIAEHILFVFKVAVDKIVPDAKARDQTHVERQAYVVRGLIDNIPDEPDEDVYEALFHADKQKMQIKYDNLPVGDAHFDSHDLMDQPASFVTINKEVPFDESAEDEAEPAAKV